jgi:hypothetical protein
MPYEEYIGDYCDCKCCFSIKFEIEGIKNKDFEVYFNNKKIEISADHYKTREPSYVMYEGKKINYTNKYGFREGLWIFFYENGIKKTIIKYPENSLYDEPAVEWSKRYYESGKLLNFSRQDTTESWYEDGELKSQMIKYSSGDTTFERGFIKYDNRQLKKRYLERYYPTIFMSKFDSTYSGRKGTISDNVYDEEYYSNGNKKYLLGKDTSYTWYEDGQVQYKNYRAGKLEYNEQGQLIKRSFHWEEPGSKGWGDLNHSLYIDYYENSDIAYIHFVRDQISKDGESLAPSVHYEWKWDKALNLIESPENWKEDYPWKKFNEIKISPTKYKLR